MHDSGAAIGAENIPGALVDATDACHAPTIANIDCICWPVPSEAGHHNALVKMEQESDVPIAQLKNLSIKENAAEDMVMAKAEEKPYVKIEKKEELSMKEEDKSEATIVTVFLPLPEQQLMSPKPLGIGEIPSNYVTEEDRAELLDSCVKRHSIGGEGVRKDMLHFYSKTFVAGVIEGLFETHLLKATYEEVRAINKRTARRRRRHHKSAQKAALRESNKHGYAKGSGKRKGKGKGKRRGKSKERRSWNSASMV